MNRHLERIKAEEEAFFKGKSRRNRVPFLTILLAFAMLFIIKQVAVPGAAVQPGPTEKGDVTLSQPEESYWNLRLISSDAPIAEDETPTLSTFGEVQVDSRILPNLRQLLRAAEKDGIELAVISGYRTIAQQQALREELAEQARPYGYTEEQLVKLVDTALERPGESDFHTGLAVCFGNSGSGDFAASEAGQWLAGHAAEYGFLLRYPGEKEAVTHRAGDAAHYRYVGPETAQYMNEMNLCLEEYRQRVFAQNTTPGEG